MTTKTIYPKELLLQLREAAVAMEPSDQLRQSVKTVEDTTETPAVKPLSRFERHQEKQKAIAAAPPPSRQKFDKFSQDGHDRGATGWRGDKDRETFEEGYLYELRESAKQRRIVASAIVEHDDKTAAAAAVASASAAASSHAAAAAAASSQAPAPLHEEAFKVEDDGFFQALNAKPRTSRFFSAGGGDAKDDDVPSSVARAPVRQTSVDPVDIAMPSSTVVWNQRPAAATTAPAPAAQKAPAAAAVAPVSQKQATPEPQQIQRPSRRGQQQQQQQVQQQAPAQPALPRAAPANVNVISAADLESKLFSQQKNNLAVPANAVMGTFDASQLEQQLLAKAQAANSASSRPTAPVAPQQQQPQAVSVTHQPLPVPTAAPYPMQQQVLRMPQQQQQQQQAYPQQMGMPMRPVAMAGGPQQAWGMPQMVAAQPPGVATYAGYYPSGVPGAGYQTAPMQMQPTMMAVYPQQQVYGFSTGQHSGYMPRQ